MLLCDTRGRRRRRRGTRVAVRRSSWIPYVREAFGPEVLRPEDPPDSGPIENEKGLRLRRSHQVINLITIHYPELVLGNSLIFLSKCFETGCNISLTTHFNRCLAYHQKFLVQHELTACPRDVSETSIPSIPAHRHILHASIIRHSSRSIIII